jgi:hypothetical protein
MMSLYALFEIQHRSVRGNNSIPLGIAYFQLVPGMS